MGTSVELLGGREIHNKRGSGSIEDAHASRIRNTANEPRHKPAMH